MPPSGSKTSVPYYQTEIPSAPVFEPEGVVFNMSMPQNDKLVIQIKEETRSSKISSEDGRKTNKSYTEIQNESYEYE